MTGPAKTGWTVAVRSRVAAGIRVRVGVVRAANPRAVTASVARLPWHGLVHPRQSVIPKVVGQRMKGRRDSVEAAIRRGVEQALRGPRLPSGRPPRHPANVLARVDGDRIELSIDAAGELLHRRGWRKATAKAPLRENLAAAVLRLAGWTPKEWLVDPMCGSGTFPIEAGQVAEGLYPGARRRFAFEDWPSHDARAWASFQKQRGRKAPDLAGILGADRAEGALRAARSNLERSGARKVVSLEQRDVRELEPPAENGLIVCNPPWGIRIGGSSARAAWAALGATVRERFAGWRVALVGPSPDLARATGLRLDQVATFPAGGQRLAVWIGGPRGQSSGR